jgi:hypothetical protein
VSEALVAVNLRNSTDDDRRVGENIALNLVPVRWVVLKTQPGNSLDKD